MDLVRQARESSRPPPFEAALKPFQEYIDAQTLGGVLLLVATTIALLWANSPWSETYAQVWRTPITVGVGTFVLAKPLHLWVNDGLMAMFFFVVGLEIKRELLAGELSDPRLAILPIFAAAGGMLVPAAVYLSLNTHGEAVSGWGIPIATDIAFALGILALLGKRVPFALKVFLVTLAIVDDLGAVLVIALFYTSTISLENLAVGALFLIALIGANRAGIRHPVVYATLGVGGLWLAFLLSGVHATVAGVLVAMTIPACPRIGHRELVDKANYLIRQFDTHGETGSTVLANPKQAEAATALETASDLAQTPLQRLEHSLQPWVTLGVMPVFALANAGVDLSGDVLEALTHPVALGIALGLMVGKQLGITVFSWVAVKANLASLPEGVGWRHIYGASWLGGIGFTMSLFIAGLAFGESSLLPLAKVGILSASVLAGIAGWLILRGAGGKNAA